MSSKHLPLFNFSRVLLKTRLIFLPSIVYLFYVWFISLCVIVKSPLSSLRPYTTTLTSYMEQPVYVFIQLIELEPEEHSSCQHSSTHREPLLSTMLYYTQKLIKKGQTVADPLALTMLFVINYFI